MPTITSKKDVCHVWAQQERTRGKAGNVFFEGPTIYSYGHHFPIASFTKDRDGNECVLLTTRGHSSSTANHISCTRQAVTHKTVYMVDDVLAESKGDHKKNHDAMIHAFERLAAQFSKKRTASTKNALVEELKELASSANSYCRAFRLGRKALEVPDDIQSLREKLRKDLEDQQKRDAAKIRKKQEKREAEYQRALADWLLDKVDAFHGMYEHRRPTKMRIVERDGRQVIQTTRGASFPADHAKRAWPHIKRCREQQCNGGGIRVGEFHIDSIDYEGNVIAGCHTLEFAEIERIAGLLGLS